MNETIEQIFSTEKITEQDYYAAVIDGIECQMLNTFLAEIGKAFEFPDYYGQNLDALDECLNDLEWINKPNYILIVNHSKKLLCKEIEGTKQRVIGILENASIQWANVPNYEGEDSFRKKADFRIKLC